MDRRAFLGVATGSLLAAPLAAEAQLNGLANPTTLRRPKVRRMIKRLREERKVSQLELGKKSGVAQGYISALEAGTKANPGLDVLSTLAKALGVPVTELFG